MSTPKQFHDAKARKAPAAKSNSTRRILHIINSDEEVESHEGQRQPTDSDEREDDSDDKKEDDDSEVDNGDLAQDEDNDLRHLHASQVKATLQQEVKCHLIRKFAHNVYLYQQAMWESTPRQRLGRLRRSTHSSSPTVADNDGQIFVDTSRASVSSILLLI